MKQTVGFSEFQDAFTNLRPQNFSLQGLGVLWDYLEQYEDDTGTELELDVIALCCDFSEDSWQNIADNYRIDLDNCEDDDEKEETVREYLEDEGALVGAVEGGFVYRNF
jgi:hypothetical protein